MTICLNYISNECIACGSLNIQSSPAFLMPFISHRVFGQAQEKISAESTGLRDVKEGYNYHFCKSLFCKACGHLACDLRFNDLQMKNLYQGYRNQTYVELRDFYEPGYLQRNQQFHSEYPYKAKVREFIESKMNRKPNSILDWGGDSGINTPFSGELDKHHIFDISNVAPIAGATLVNEEMIGESEYDLVVCQHVLEHLPFPGDSLLNLKNKTKGNPYFYFEVPHEPIMRKTSKGELPLKRHWHEHINFYSESSLKALIERCGLKSKAIKSLEVSSAIGEDIFILQCIAY